MGSTGASHALSVERSCTLLASAFSEGRRESARLMTGEHRAFGLNTRRAVVNVPYPYPVPGWSLRTLTCGVALQCSPSKDRISEYALRELTDRELRALAVVEGEVAMGWIASRWPGLMGDLKRHLPGFKCADPEMSALEMIDRARDLSSSSATIEGYPLLGQLTLGASPRGGLIGVIQKLYGQMPWSSKRPLSKALHTIPVGGQGGARNPNLPPPSRPEDEDPEISAAQRSGIPYPEWNAWTQQFLKDHVAVLERTLSPNSVTAQPATADLSRYFEEHTHRAMRNRLEDGSDLDIDSYIKHYVSSMVGTASEARVFRELKPAARDVTTALLLDGSSSLGAGQGRIFKLELSCADALCKAMSRARERHGLFVFSGNTRHRVDVTCLKDFDDPRKAIPSGMGLVTGGYTRLGAPIRHLTSRLLAQPSERRLLILIGDGLMSDEGYEGKYAWADVAHAVKEAEDAGVSTYYIGVGPTRVDPLPEVFGARRSKRIRQVEELPRVLAHVHRELIAA